MTPCHGRLRGDDGVLTLLIIGFTAIAALMVVVTTSVSAVYLARRELVSTVDAAAVAAAQQVDADSAYAEGLGEGLPLLDAGVEQVVAEIARRNPRVRFATPQVVDGNSVVVVAERVVDLRFARVLGVASWTVRARARARAPLR